MIQRDDENQAIFEWTRLRHTHTLMPVVSWKARKRDLLCVCERTVVSATTKRASFG